MKVGDRVRTPLGFTGTVTRLYEMSTHHGAHVHFDPVQDVPGYHPVYGPYPLSLLTLITEENTDDKP